MKDSMENIFRPDKYFNLEDDQLAAFFDNCKHVWQALERLEDNLHRLIGNERSILGEIMPGAHLGDSRMYIAPTARVEPGAYVMGPAYIGDGVVIRHGAFVRENVIMFHGSVLGHACEAKNSLFFPRATAPHFNYVGDSILGHRINLGAGTKLSNLTLVSEKDAISGKRPTITLRIANQEIDTGLAKFGAILGDDSQTGCNSVLNPGCIVGPRTLVYANISLRKGYYPPDTIVKLRQQIDTVERL